MVTFANLAGFWALLGIPVILLIHFLQRQSQIQVVSTLFLLEALDRESVQGQKFDRIRNSIPLWLQLLAVLLLTWILVQPRWTRENSVQKIAIVLDSSASMRAFKEPALEAIRKEVPELSRGAKTVELVVLESHLDGEPLFNGTSLLDLGETLDTWSPYRPAHDPGPALRVGRSLSGSKGIVLYVTDHPVENPGYDSKVLSVGDPIANVGFAGVDVDNSTNPPTWQAMVKNYSETPQTREWFLQAGQQRTETRNLSLKGGETRTLQGRFPAAASGITLRLAPDQFDQDDQAPMVIPEPKQLAVAKLSVPKLDKLMEGMIASFENTIPPTEESGIDLVLSTYNPLSPTKPEPVSIVLIAQETPGRNFFKGPIVASNHPLVSALNWQGLIARSSPGIPVGPEDTILLWQGERALIILRENAEQRQLIYNFDVPSSNVDKLPSFIVLSHRFVESIRDDKIAPFSANHELNQAIQISCDRDAEAPALDVIAGGQKTSVPLNQINALKAPAEPGFFEIRQGDQTLLTGAAQFVDTREADFSAASSVNDLANLKTTAVTEHTRKDDIWQIWLLLILVAILLSWYFIKRKKPTTLEAATALILFSVTPGIAAPDYTKEVRPILEKHCFKCHGPDKQKGKVRLDTLATDFIENRQAAETWHDALDSVNLGEMPPEDEPGLSSPERATLNAWIEHNLDLVRKAGSPDQEGIVLRRLNRAEYGYTMRDLLGFDMDYTASLPSDSYSEDGFLNNGAALKMSGMQLEAYLETSREAMKYILVEGEAPKQETKSFNPKFKARGKLPPGKNDERLGRNHYWSGSIQGMPRTGPITIRVTARAEQIDDQPALLNAEYGYFVGGLTTTFRKAFSPIEIDSTDSKVYEFRGRAEFFPQPDARVPDNKLNGVVVLYNALKDGEKPPKPMKKTIPQPADDKSKKKKRPKTETVYPEDPSFPKVIIEKVEFVQNDYPSWPPPGHTRITGTVTNLDDESAIKQILSSFLKKAWRRTVADAELDKWISHYREVREKSESSTEALREILALSLASNQFLYLTEPNGDKNSRPLNQHELAARLSYFLWSSMPDQALSNLADQGKLSSKTLATEFDRMINHEKSDRFIEQFATQWLDLDAPDRIAINPQYYKDFDEALKPLMVQETREFFAEVLRNDHSALSFLNADFTMANKRLATHYGLTGPKGSAFERISLKGSDRVGGLLGQASVHMAGSDGANSHPIKRAVWIRERLLHDPPKPPPPNVPSVEESVPNFNKLTVREQMEVHRQKEACADCHRGIDPWGIAMEHYDAIGLKREKMARINKPIDATTELPGGHVVNGLEGLQAFLVDQRSDQFAHALVSKMMTYALGRSLEFSDELLVDQIAESFKADGYRLKPMMKNIITSSVFMTR